MRREERVTVEGPVKEQQPDGMSHRGGRLLKSLTVMLVTSTIFSAFCYGLAEALHFQRIPNVLRHRGLCVLHIWM